MLADVLPKELYDRIHEAANDPYFEPPDPGVLPTWNGATGELIKNIPMLRMYRVSRRRMRAFCAQGIDVTVCILSLNLSLALFLTSQQYGKKIKDVTYDDSANTVTAHFEDGSATGTLLIGADGAKSVVRRLIFGEEKGKIIPVPYCGVNTHVTYGDRDKALFVRQRHPIMTHAVHPDGYWIWISSRSSHNGCPDIR